VPSVALVAATLQVNLISNFNCANPLQLLVAIVQQQSQLCRHYTFTKLQQLSVSPLRNFAAQANKLARHPAAAMLRNMCFC
jgi:hypothetical protein